MRPATTTAGDVLATVLVGAVGVVFLVLAVLSVPRWWTTKFEFPPPILETLALASGAFIAFLITWLRLPLLSRYDWERPHISSHRDGKVSVFEGNVSHRPVLRRLGGKRRFTPLGFWTFEAPDERSLARVLSDLRDAGAVFPADDYKGYTVSDEFIALRERGLVSGTFYQSDRGGLLER